MSKYEVMYITRVIADKALEAINDELTKIIKSDGDVGKLDVWGEKMLAYNIDGNERGIYVLITFEGNGSCISAIDHFMRIKQDIIRHMIIKKCM